VIYDQAGETYVATQLTSEPSTIYFGADGEIVGKWTSETLTVFTDLTADILATTATYAVSAGSADTATTATYAASAGTASTATVSLDYKDRIAHADGTSTLTVKDTGGGIDSFVFNDGTSDRFVYSADGNLSIDGGFQSAITGAGAVDDFTVSGGPGNSMTFGTLAGDLTITGDFYADNIDASSGTVTAGEVDASTVTASQVTATTVVATSLFGDGGGITGIQQGNIIYDLFDDACTVWPQYRQLSLDAPGAEATLSTTVATTTQSLGGWVTCTLGITQLGDSTSHLHLHVQQTAGADVAIYYNLYKRSAAGVNTLIATSSDSDPLTGDIETLDIYAQIPPTALAETDVLLLELVAHELSGGVDPQITIYLEGTDRRSWYEIAIPSNNYVTYTNAIKDVDLGDNSIAASTVTGADLAATDDLTVADDATISGDLITTTIHQVSDTSMVLGLSMNPESINSTTIFDSSKYSNHGTVSGAMLTTDGIIGTAIEFDGTNDYIDLPTSILVSENIAAGGSGSVSMWVRPDTLTGPMPLIIDAPLGTLGSKIELAIVDTGDLVISYYTTSGGYNDFFADAALTSAGEWYHIVGIWDSLSSATLYLDGAELVIADGPDYNSGGAQRVLIGADARASKTDYFDGAIDAIRMYDRALSADEVAQLYYQRAEVARSHSAVESISINTNETSATLNVGGTIDASGNIYGAAFVATSDESLKDIAGEALTSETLETLADTLATTAILYRLRNNDSSSDFRLGFRAQDMPAFVKRRMPNGYYGIDHGALISYQHEIIKRLVRRVKKQEKYILQNRQAVLRERNRVDQIVEWIQNQP